MFCFSEGGNALVACPFGGIRHYWVALTAGELVSYIAITILLNTGKNNGNKNAIKNRYWMSFCWLIEKGEGDDGECTEDEKTDDGLTTEGESVGGDLTDATEDAAHSDGELIEDPIAESEPEPQPPSPAPEGDFRNGFSARRRGVHWFLYVFYFQSFGPILRIPCARTTHSASTTWSTNWWPPWPPYHNPYSTPWSKTPLKNKNRLTKVILIQKIKKY